MLIVNIGTGAQGGIDSVINGYIADGLYQKLEHRRVISHLGKNKLEDIYLFIKSIFILLFLGMLNKKVIFHCHLSYKGSFWRKLIFLIISKITFSKIIMHLHGSEFKNYFESSSILKQKLITFLIRHSTRFVVLSDGWSQYIKSISGITPVVINNYVDVPVVDAKGGSNRSGILFLGAFIKRKGIYDLLNAYKLLNTEENLHLCGAGEDLKVKELVSKLNIEDKVIFHGWVNSEEKFNLLSRCRIFILPTYNEGLPMSIIEAMGSRIPIITTPVGAIPEVINNNINGLIVKEGNIDSIKEGLETALSNPKLIIRMTQDAYATYIKNFTSKTILPKWSKLYENINLG